MPDKTPEYMRDRLQARISAYMSDRMPEYMPEDMSDRMPEYMSDRMPDKLYVFSYLLGHTQQNH